MKLGFKKRKSGKTGVSQASFSEEGALQQSWTLCCLDLLKTASAEASGLGGEGSKMVCLVDSKLCRHPIISQLSMFKVRESELEGKASFILPAKKVAFLFIEGGFVAVRPGQSKDDAEILRAVHQNDLFIESRKKFREFSSSYANAIVMVMGNVELFNYLALDSISSPSATVIYCGSLDHAVRHLCHRASLPDLTQRSATYDKAVSAVFAQPALHQHVAKAIPEMPPNQSLTGTDLLDLLSGRVSQDVCSEHFGWSRTAAADVMRALEVNRTREI